MFVLTVTLCCGLASAVSYGPMFLEEHAKRDDVVVLPSGLQYRVITPGRPDGETPTDKSDCVVDYEGKLADNGRVFDSSFKRGKPSVFKPTKVVKGFREALLMMKEGAKWEIVCPPELGYGHKKRGRLIPSYSTLIFELTFIKIKRGPDDWEDSGAVVHLKDKLFAGYRAKHPQMMTFFYAPWCGHCKKFKPHYTKASNELKDIVPLTAVDCDSNRGLCVKFNVESFPTVFYFNSTDDKGLLYTGPRTVDDLVPQIKEYVSGATYTRAEKMKSWEEQVVSLSGARAHIDLVADPNKAVKVVMFYSPTCSFSKAMMPHFGEVAETLKGNSKVSFGSLACVAKNKKLCKEIGIVGFPTIFVHFRARPHGIKYEGPRNADGLSAYLNRVLSLAKRPRAPKMDHVYRN